MTTATEVAPSELAVRAAPTDGARGDGGAGAVALAALPGLLTLYLSFNAGGFYPGAQGAVVVVLAAVVILRMAFVRDPFAGFSRPLFVAVAALTTYAVWALMSSRWSHAPARALFEFELASVYLFTVLLFGCTGRSHRRVRLTLVLTWLAMLFVCLAALATRLRPDLFPIPVNLDPDRLAFPLTYWNALGLFAAIGLILGSHLASSTRVPRSVRVLATAAIPVFAVTVLLTYSRAAIAIGALGLIAYLLLARPRGALSTLLAAAPTTAFAVASTYQANLISNGITSPAAVAQGRHLTTTLTVACIAAGLIRIAVLEIDARLSELTMSPQRRANARSVLGVLCLAAVFVAFLGFGGQITRQWNIFTKQNAVTGNDVRGHIGINNFRIGDRLTGWRIAIEVFDQNPLHGRGAGTFPIDWFQLRPYGETAIEAHSLYLQAMSDLGLVGLIAIVVALIVMIGACFVRARHGARSLWTVVGVVGLVWAIHAGVDWDWEMPAVTLPVFALMATALARRGGGTRLRREVTVGLRLAVGLVAALVLVTSVRVVISERHLDRSVADFNNGHCPAAVANARTTISAVSSRPQAYQIIALCDVVTGHPQPGVQLMDQAVARDPQNWVYRYSLALARAAVGQDPQPSLRRAAWLDPLEPMIPAAEKAFKGEGARGWERTAKHMGLLVTTTDE